MLYRSVLSMTFFLAVACAIFVPFAKADERDQLTKLSFNQPVEVPGQVLPAGSYWFVLQPNDSNREVVQIYSDDWSQLYATVQTIPTQRPQPTDQTEVRFAERPHNQPEALLRWYYPGFQTGHEFVYSSSNKRELQQDGKQDVLAAPAL
jgi:hypothetical protein